MVYEPNRKSVLGLKASALTASMANLSTCTECHHQRGVDAKKARVDETTRWLACGSMCSYHATLTG